MKSHFGYPAKDAFSGTHSDSVFRRLRHVCVIKPGSGSAGSQSTCLEGKPASPQVSHHATSMTPDSGYSAAEPES